MYEVLDKTLKKAFKPYDVVTNSNGDVGFIQEVSVNDCQPEPYQISYAVNWLVGKAKHAWFDHNELTKHSNLFVKIAESSCHPSGRNENHVKRLFENFNVK
jgi:hypothetical protein